MSSTNGTNVTEFTIKVNMRTRWIPHFLGMLKRMQYLGSIGSSREITIYSDGDGDFRPVFEWDRDLPVPVEPLKEFPNGNTFFDAG